MHKISVLLAAMLLLSGCKLQQTMETVGDVDNIEVVSRLQQLELDLPKETFAPALQNESGERIYMCDDYTICVQTFEGGDMDRTLKTLTGFSKDDLTVMETEVDGVKRVSCVWSAAGEGGDHIGRALVLDDGNYHYAVSVMAEFSKVGDLSSKWKELFESVRLTDTD
jgi:hypothetical protein